MGVNLMNISIYSNNRMDKLLNGNKDNKLDYVKKYTFEQRRNESSIILQKYPDRIAKN